MSAAEVARALRDLPPGSVLHVEQAGRVWTCAILLPDRGEVRAQSTTSAEAALLSAVDLAEVLS